MVATTKHSAIALVADYVLLVIDFMQPRGLTADALLAGTDFCEADLRRQPEQPISLDTLFKLMHNLHTHDSSPTLSLEFGLSLKLSNHGFLGYALQSSQTLGDALRLAHDFAQTRSQIISFSFYEDDCFARIGIADHGSLGIWYPHIVETLLACFFSIGTTLLGAVASDQIRLTLAIEAQSHHELILQMFGAHVHFDCTTTEIMFPAAWLDTRLPQSDPQLAALAASRCRDELAAQHYAAQQTLQAPEFIADILKLIKDNMASDQPQAAVADALHITPRTLHRRLAQQGLQFKTLLDELRHAAARDYLMPQRDALADIALALGYSDQANFVRAFKRWTGQTPSQFQRALDKGATSL